jgi:threonine dehydrogenase-like Zn-dependent dehydrogenase
MSSVVFEKAVITCTFLVDSEDISTDELLRPAEGAQELDSMPSEQVIQEILAEVPDIPQFLAEGAVQRLFQRIIDRTRPQGVVVMVAVVGEEMDAPHVATLRQKIQSGERSGQAVTVRLAITRDNPLPFPGFTWLTSQIHDEPGRGMDLLYLSVAQVPG